MFTSTPTEGLSPRTIVKTSRAVLVIAMGWQTEVLESPWQRTGVGLSFFGAPQTRDVMLANKQVKSALRMHFVKPVEGF